MSEQAEKLIAIAKEVIATGRPLRQEVLTIIARHLGISDQEMPEVKIIIGEAHAWQVREEYSPL